MNKYFLFLLPFWLFSTLCFAQSDGIEGLIIENYGEQSGKYIVACIAIEFLNKKYCSDVAATNVSTCTDEVLGLLPNRYKPYFHEVIDTSIDEMYTKLVVDIDRGFNKTLKLFNNENEKACISYATALYLMKYQAFEQLKLLKRHLK